MNERENEKELPQLSRRAYNLLYKIFDHEWYRTAHEVEAAPMDRLEDLLQMIAENEKDYTALLGMQILDWVCDAGAVKGCKRERVARERREQRAREKHAA